MGRRKQSRPRRSGALIVRANDDIPTTSSPSTTTTTVSSSSSSSSSHAAASPTTHDHYVLIHSCTHSNQDHLDISEVILTDLNIALPYADEDFFHNFTSSSSSGYSLRFRVSDIDRNVVDRIKLGHWPVLSSTHNIFVELMDKETQAVIISGRLDGPDVSVTSLVHLTSMEFLTLRPIQFQFSLRLRVEILKAAFDACRSLLENTRQPWKKSMINVMAWLRPEVMTSEVRYGITTTTTTTTHMDEEEEEEEQVDDGLVGHTSVNSTKSFKFNVAGFYEAIKPSK